MTHSEAYNIVRRCFASGRMPHAYLVNGAPRGIGAAFAGKVSKLLLCQTPKDGEPCGACKNCIEAEAGRHADMMFVEPESKSRQIPVKIINEKVIPWALRGSFMGGWKICVILFADRLNDSSSNSLLKILEEPPPKTLFMLISETPEVLLPTIISRCQRLDLTSGRTPPTEPFRTNVAKILSKHSCSSELSSFATAGRLENMLADIGKEAEQIVSAEVSAVEYSEVDDKITKARSVSLAKEMRQPVYQAMRDWYRDIMAVRVAGPDTPLFFEEFREEIKAKAAELSEEKAIECLECIDGLFTHIETRNIRPAIALAYWVGRLR